MKYIFSLLLLIIFPLAAFHAHAQKNQDDKDVPIDRQIKGEIIGGINLSQVDGDQVYGFNRVGANVGFGGILPLGHHFSMSVEVLFDQKGAFRKYAPETDSVSNIPYYSLQLNYVKAPIMFHYEDRNTWTFGLGFSYGRLVGFRELEHNDKQEWDRPYITYKTKNDFDIIADIRFRLWKHLKIDAQYSYSLLRSDSVILIQIPDLSIPG